MGSARASPAVVGALADHNGAIEQASSSLDPAVHTTKHTKHTKGKGLELETLISLRVPPSFFV